MNVKFARRALSSEARKVEKLPWTYPWWENLNIYDIEKGSITFLNCYYEGTLLCLGDVHASQGDSEFTGHVNKCKAEFTLKCSVTKNRKIPYVRVETKKSIISIFAINP